AAANARDPLDLQPLDGQPLDGQPLDGQPPDRATRLAAAGLAERETGLVRLADGALRLLDEDGNSIAFPETVQQLRSDMQQTAAWLAEARLGSRTQQLQEDIIEQLQTAIAAFEKAAADKQQEQEPAGGRPSSGQQGGPPLVDIIAELRMVRSLQVRLLRRTEMWDTLTEQGEVEPRVAEDALRRLGRNQQRLAEAAESLHKKLKRP
ncbi:MAG: hypothetical protein AAGG46_02885, partial [Planctomycetota bacterium]